MKTHSTVSVEGCDWAVLDQGAGPPVLLVHAFPLDHTVWRHQIDALSPQFRVIAPDLPGFGNTPLAKSSASMASTAKSLFHLLETLAVHEPVTFVGLSMGGYIGWEFIRQFPEHVSRLIQCDTRAAGDTPSARENRLQTADRVKQEGAEFLAVAMPEKLLSANTRDAQPELAAELADVIRAIDPAGIAAALLGMADRSDMTPALAEITTPTLMICGEHDALTPAAEMKANAMAMPAAAMVEIATAGHLSPLEAPTDVNQAIIQFLKH